MSKGILHFCRTISEACVGAASTPTPGLVVSVFEDEGMLCVRQATSTIFGPINRRHDAPDREYIESLVLDTLEVGEYDVWLVSADIPLAEIMIEQAGILGHHIDRMSGEIPPQIADPFGLFERRPTPQTANVVNFCQVDPRVAEIKVGDVLHMDCADDGLGGCVVLYTTQSGIRLGPHGALPFPIDEYGIERLHEVRARVQYVNWGRGWREGRLTPIQIVLFEIPADVHAMLADSKLPPIDSGGHL